MAATIFFATLSALSSACGAVLQRLALGVAPCTTARAPGGGAGGP
jgi:hypothetical protein